MYCVMRASVPSLYNVYRCYDNSFHCSKEDKQEIITIQAGHFDVTSHVFGQYIPLPRNSSAITRMDIQCIPRYFLLPLKEPGDEANYATCFRK